MLTSLEDLADKIETSNQNTRELLLKLSLWDTVEDVDAIEIKLRTPTYPYFEKYSIPTKNKIIQDLKIETEQSKVECKDWGYFSLNEILRSEIILDDSNKASFNIVRYDGSLDSEGAVTFVLPSSYKGDSLEFIVYVKTPFKSTNNHLVVFKNEQNVKICGVSNNPLGSYYDNVQVSDYSQIPLTYKVSFKYVEDSNLNLSWRLFDYYLMPSFSYDGTNFNYNSTFKT